MALYHWIKQYFFEKYPNLMQEYDQYLSEHGNVGVTGKFKAYTFLLKLCLFGEKNRIKKIQISEIEDNQRDDVAVVVKKLSGYDVVSFDLFDTLVLRNVSQPSDVFRLVEFKYGIHNFAHIRKKAEKECVDKLGMCYTLSDIYNLLQLQYGISKDVLMKELEIEKQICVINPYMKEIYEELHKKDQNIVILTDTYFSKEFITDLLTDLGLSMPNDIIISCECKKSKSVGDVYELFHGKNVIHVGDNYRCDIQNAKKAGCSAYYYKSSQLIGKKYRIHENNISIGAALSNGLVNNTFFNGCKMNDRMQLGYAYLGPVSVGYCQWIYTVAKENDVTKLLFLSRDADILYKTYNDLHLDIDSEYVYVSRNALLLLVFDRYEDLFIENLRKWTKKKSCTIQTFLQANYLIYIDGFLKEAGLCENDILSAKSFDSIAYLIKKYKKELYDSMADMRCQAKKYWERVIGTNKKVALVDIGWRANSYVCLRYFLEEICGMEVDLINFQLGTKNTEYNDVYFADNKLFSYVFAPDKNAELMSSIATDEDKIAVLEKVFTSPAGTLLSYETDKDGFFEYTNSQNDNEAVINDVQNGALCFSRDYKKMLEKLNLNIYLSSEEVFGNMILLCEQQRLMDRVYSSFYYSSISGDEKETINKGVL